MPNPRTPPWNQIIPLIPVDDQVATVEAATWQSFLTKSQQAAVFGGSATIQLSRKRLLTHRYTTDQQKCLEVYIWGWPVKSRGDHREQYLKNLDLIAKVAPKDMPWPDYYDALHSLGGLGISAISKLAYFYGHKFEGMSAVILDQRVIAALSAGGWKGLSMPGIRYGNANARYLEYLQMVNAASGGVGGTPAQVEMLLFTWGMSF